MCGSENRYGLLIGLMDVRSNKSMEEGLLFSTLFDFDSALRFPGPYFILSLSGCVQHSLNEYSIVILMTYADDMNEYNEIHKNKYQFHPFVFLAFPFSERLIPLCRVIFSIFLKRGIYIIRKL